MKNDHLKVLVISIFSFSFLAFSLFQNSINNRVKADDDVAAEYKTKCAMCHSPKAEKFFNASKSIEVLTEVILKGNTTSKPAMPGFETKGMKPEQAKALAEYMVSLRKPAESNANAANAVSNSVSANSNSTVSNSNCVCPPTNSTVVNTNVSNAISNFANTNEAITKPAFDEQVIAAYKTKCSGCHSPKAEKFFDPTKTDEVYLDAVLKGKKTSKPPMPGYEEKGLKPEDAKVLINYMKSLRVENK
ncbi:MAG: cytochrome c [Pyrinomonadaceae bacterium]|nr:cytochrome c [Pyrinomonadaceae bacterium]